MKKSLELAIEKFNNRDFFTCHDILEDIWYVCLPAEKDFYQGLLHYAVAFHHLVNKKNLEGAKLQFKKSIEKLDKYARIHEGINVFKIINSAKKFTKTLEAENLKNIRIPKI